MNALGIGPQGLGGDSTSFAFHVETAATHIIMNPVAVNIQCHSARRASVTFTPVCTGGVHRANRLGANKIANSTVFGGVACDTTATCVSREGALVAPDATALDAATAALEASFAWPARNLSPLRDALQEMMWDEAGILRDAAGLAEATSAVNALEAELDASGVDGANRAFNLTWHDWLNLKSLLLVSRAIVVASIAREESRGAHWCEDFPQTNDEVAGLSATSVRLEGDHMVLQWQQVAFTR